MTLVELLLIGLAMTGLIGMGIVLGATIMWRLVHRVAQPPPLPIWVSILALCSVLLIVVPMFAAGQWLAALLVAAGVAVQFVAHGYDAIRRRRGSSP